MTVDELGNVYIVKADNNLVRFDENGNRTGTFNGVQNGDIRTVDASDPLRILLYYPAYSKLVFLDQMLTQKNELDLRRQNIFNAAVASSSDGFLWVYDPFNVKLKKLDEQLSSVLESNEIRQEARAVPDPSFLTERNQKVYLCDTAKGIFTFDRYGNYVSTLPISGVKYLQVFGNQLVYRIGDTLFSYDFQRILTKSLLLPKNGTPILQAALSRNFLYVLYSDRLVYYQLREDEIR